MNNQVEIFVLNSKGQTFMIKTPKKVTFSQLKQIIKDNKTDVTNHFYIVFNGITYHDKINKNEPEDIFKFEEGDKITLFNSRIDENYVNAEFHFNPNLNEGDMSTCPLTGNLKIYLLKYISKYININSIKSEEIRNIMKELKENLKVQQDPEKDIQANLQEKNGQNIIDYSNYINSIINDKEVDKLLNLVDKSKKNEIINYWSILSKYESFNKLFEAELLKALEKSYFDFSLIGLSIFQQNNRKQYLAKKQECENIVTKYLFHGTRIDPISKIITGGFLYTKKAFYGMGIYFTDMLDYAAFYAGGTDDKSRRDNFGIIPPVNSTFTCVSAEIYYNKAKKKDIYDFSLHVDELDHFPTYEEIRKNYGDKMVEKNGVHYVRVEPDGGQVRNREEIIEDSRVGKFLGTEYVITEFSQILPLYGLTFQRNEYVVVWRDPNFEGINEYSEYLKQRKLFIYKEAKMNAYFESSTEKALEIIKRKRHNKIILISSCGKDLSGRKFAEIARQILGFNAVVLFFSANEEHLKWIQEFPNSLYTNDAGFYREYILNYNEEGLLKLKNKIEKNYDIKLKFSEDYFKFPKFVNSCQYNDVTFEKKSPNFKNVIIKNTQNDSVLCMEPDGTVSFKPAFKLEINKYQWYVTMLGNEITLFSNGNYLDANINQKRATSFQYMIRYNFVPLNSVEYIIYFKDKSNVLTVNGNYASLDKEHSDRSNQKFKLIEEIEY